MKFKKITYVILIACVSSLLVSCGTSTRVASSFSKRKYMKGYFFDFPASAKTAVASISKPAINQVKATPEPEQTNLVVNKEMNSQSVANKPQILAVKNTVHKQRVTATVEHSSFSSTTKESTFSEKSVLDAPPSYHHSSDSGSGGDASKNWAAVTGFICAFLFALLGIIFSAIGLKSERHGLALAGLIISILSIILELALIA